MSARTHHLVSHQLRAQIRTAHTFVSVPMVTSSRQDQRESVKVLLMSMKLVSGVFHLSRKMRYPGSQFRCLL